MLCGCAWGAAREGGHVAHGLPAARGSEAHGGGPVGTAGRGAILAARVVIILPLLNGRLDTLCARDDGCVMC